MTEDAEEIFEIPPVANSLVGLISFCLDKDQDEDELTAETMDIFSKLVCPVLGNRNESAVSDEEVRESIIKVLNWIMENI